MPARFMIIDFQRINEEPMYIHHIVVLAELTQSSRKLYRSLYYSLPKGALGKCHGAGGIFQAELWTGS